MIRLDPKFGVNPSCAVCFFCGEAKAVVLFGAARSLFPASGGEAPRNVVTDYEPCEKCSALMAQGFTLMEVTEDQPDDKRPPLVTKGGRNAYPTGRYCVITREAQQRVFPEVVGDFVLVEKGVLEMIGAFPGEAERRSADG